MSVEKLIEKLGDLKERKIHLEIVVAILQELKEDIRSDKSMMIVLFEIGIFIMLIAFLLS